MMRLFWLLGLISMTFSVFAVNDNVRISGALVSQPCTLSQESEDIHLNFGNLISTFFYHTERTAGENFTITLANCDITIGSSATVTFKGTESQALPGLLSPDDGDTHGIAFGIETNEGAPRPVPLNKASPVFTLSKGTNDLALRGYVQAEPAAIAARSITAGSFTATATFEIEYP
ncbi:fimbrial protein [Huaxiibacter chinensis]